LGADVAVDGDGDCGAEGDGLELVHGEDLGCR
jgi:hypothetical protein